MAFTDQLADLEGDLKSAGVALESVLARAGLDRATWTRWKNGTFTPRLANWIKVQDAARDLIADAKPREAAA